MKTNRLLPSSSFQRFVQTVYTLLLDESSPLIKANDERVSFFAWILLLFFFFLLFLIKIEEEGGRHASVNSNAVVIIFSTR